MDNEYAKWIIRGGDSNPDLSGPHNHPIIGYAEGYYNDVIGYAKTLKGWEASGSDGFLEKFNMPKFKKIKSPRE